jgi:hypothetical protein
LAAAAKSSRVRAIFIQLAAPVSGLGSNWPVGTLLGAGAPFCRLRDLSLARFLEDALAARFLEDALVARFLEDAVVARLLEDALAARFLKDALAARFLKDALATRFFGDAAGGSTANSSSLWLCLSNDFSQRGRGPRPDQVSPPGPRYLGSTLPAALGRVRPASSRCNCLWSSSAFFLSCVPISSRNFSRASTDIDVKLKRPLGHCRLIISHSFTLYHSQSITCLTRKGKHGRRPAWCGVATATTAGSRPWNGNNDADYIFGLAGNAALDALVAETALNLRFHHAMSSKAKLRTFASFMYQAGSWKRPRKVVARLECSLQPVAGETGMRQEVDIRYVVTSRRAGCDSHCG